MLAQLLQWQMIGLFYVGRETLRASNGLLLPRKQTTGMRRGNARWPGKGQS